MWPASDKLVVEVLVKAGRFGEAPAVLKVECISCEVQRFEVDARLEIDPHGMMGIRARNKPAAPLK